MVIKRTIISVAAIGITSLLFGCSFFTPAPVATPQDQHQLEIEHERYQLENGLTVILHQDHSAPLVNVNISYHVGSAREERGKTGFAHFFEHMMFQGSKHVADQQFFKIINEAGGTLNGTTDKDRTQYFETVPANQLEKVLWLESDRMGFLLDAVDQHKFEIQRATVKNERAQRVDNKPYGLVSERNSEALYPRQHPYSWQPIGYVEDLDRVTVDDLKAFFLRWYGPNNAVLTIGGDFDLNQTKQWIEQYFGPIKSGPEVEDQHPQLFSLSDDRYVTLEDRIHTPLLQISYPTVYLGHADEAPLDIFADMLGGGKSSILYKNLVQTGLATTAGASHYCQELSCTLAIWAMPTPGTADKPAPSLAQLEQAVDAAIVEFNQRGVDPDDISRVHAALEAQYLYGLETVEGRVRQLAFGELFEQNPDYMSEVLTRLANVDEPAVNRVVKQYISNAKRVVLSVVPQGQADDAAASQNFTIPPRDLTGIKTVKHNELQFRKVTDSVDRSIQPPARKVPEVHLPNLWQAQLGAVSTNNHSRVMGSYSDTSPTVSIVINFIGGAAAETPEQFGIAKLTAALLNQSSASKTVAQLSDELERLGGKISFSSNLTHNRLQIKSLVKNLPQTLALVEERLLHPAFNIAEFEQVKAQQLQSIQENRNRPQWLAGMAFQQLVYGDQSRLRESTSGNLQSVSGISLEQVKAYYRHYYHPQGSDIAIVGDVTKVQAVQALAFWQAWKPVEKAPEPMLVSAQNALNPSSIYLVDKPGAVQSVIQLGRLALPYDATGEFFRANLMNFNLGGNFNSRINQNLREDKAYTYGASSYFTGFEQFGAFIVSAEVDGNHTADAIKESLSELAQYSIDGPSKAELAYLKLAYSQGEALAYATPAQKNHFLLNLLRYQLRPDYVKQQSAIIADISADELNQLAKKYLPTAQMQIVVVGDKAKILPQLQGLGLPVVEWKP